MAEMPYSIASRGYLCRIRSAAGKGVKGPPCSRSLRRGEWILQVESRGEPPSSSLQTWRATNFVPVGKKERARCMTMVLKPMSRVILGCNECACGKQA